jgi:hypothetical protein
MSRMSKFSNEHGCGSVLETQTETDDGTGNSEHDKPVGERLKEHSGVLSPNPLNKPPEKELRSNAAEALCAVEYTELGAGGIVKVPDFVSLSAVREESWC